MTVLQWLVNSDGRHDWLCLLECLYCADVSIENLRFASKHSNSEYDAWMQHLLSVNDPMVIFTSPDLAPVITKLRSHALDRTKIIPRSLEDSMMAKKYSRGSIAQNRNRDANVAILLISEILAVKISAMADAQLPRHHLCRPPGSATFNLIHCLFPQNFGRESSKRTPRLATTSLSSCIGEMPPRLIDIIHCIKLQMFFICIQSSLFTASFPSSLYPIFPLLPPSSSCFPLDAGCGTKRQTGSKKLLT